MTDPQPHDRRQRAIKAADALILAHDIISDVNFNGELDDVLDHIGRVTRVARDTARDAAIESRR